MAGLLDLGISRWRRRRGRTRPTLREWDAADVAHFTVLLGRINAEAAERSAERAESD